MASATDLPPGNSWVQYDGKNITLHSGWVGGSDNRGSMDILWSCLLTMVLSSWSILCLNIPAENDSLMRQLWRKFLWTLMTLMGPEVVCQRAFGEWLVARRWTKEFEKSKLEGWSMTHSFYANMGGIVLVPRDEKPFPINAAQLHFLVRNQYIEYVPITKKAILDKNKVSGLLRFLILGQTLWFCLNCFARLYERISLTTLELSTLAFIPSAMGTLYFWYNKPMDVESWVTIPLGEHTSIADIRANEGQTDIAWKETPLEFVSQETEWPWNKHWYYGLTFIEKVMKMKWAVLKPKSRPIERIRDDYWPKPTLKTLPVLMFFHMSYAVILVAGWNLHLPTATELLLWRIACLIQLGTIMSAWFTMPFQIADETPTILLKFEAFCAKFQWRPKKKSKAWERWDRWVLPINEKMERIRTLNGDGPNERSSVKSLILYQITWLVYLFARMYIIVEDVISLRAMPPDAFKSVTWLEVLPHI